jgi:hypothetical protein
MTTHLPKHSLTQRVLLGALVVAAGLLWSHGVRGASYLQEGFDYAPGVLGTNSPWTGPTNLITVVSPGLTCRNVADFSPPGNAAGVRAGGTAQAITYRSLDVTVSSGVLYCSALIKYTNINASVALAGLLPSGTTVPGGWSVDPCDLVVASATGGYKLGIRAKGTTPATYASTVFALNTTYLIVMKYDFATGRASLYLRPKPGDPEPASPDATSPVTGTAVSNLKYFYLRVYDSTAGSYQIDTLRAGPTWAEVTPWAPAPPATHLAFTVAPMGGTVGARLARVVVQAFENTNAVPTNNVPVSLSLDTGSFAAGVTSAQTDANGTAVFEGLIITAPGTYTITASASGIGQGLAAGTGGAFEVGPTNTISQEGQALSAFLDSFQVEQYWDQGVSVNWLTGASGGSGPNMTHGAGTHCSAFAPAVAYVLGVYLLNPWDESDLGLANKQADWLRTNPAGWYPVAAMTNAQHLANTGILVVASYKDPDQSGHIAVLRPSTRSDADVQGYGPQECQSGVNNYNSTNVSAGFDQHRYAFPTGILYYAHSVSSPMTPVNPVFGPQCLSNGVFCADATTIVGRKYRLQGSADFIAWSNLLAFTNSNNSSNFYCVRPLTDSAGAGSACRFYRLLAQ